MSLMDRRSILPPPQVHVPALHPSPELIDAIIPTRQYHLSAVWVPGPQLPSSELRGLSTGPYLEDGSLVPQGPSTKLPNFNDPNPKSGKCLLQLLLPRCLSVFFLSFQFFNIWLIFFCIKFSLLKYLV